MDMSKTPERVTPTFLESAPNTQRFIVLPSGRLIDEALAFAFRYQVLRQASLLSRNWRYRLKEICGPEFWEPLTHGEVRLGGEYISLLVSISELPLEFATCPHASPKRYRIK